MHSRFFPKLTALRLAVIVIATLVAFGAVQQNAFAKSFCAPSTAVCGAQPQPSGAAGHSTLAGMPGPAQPSVSDPYNNYYYAGAQQNYAVAGAQQNYTVAGAGGFFGQYVPQGTTFLSHSLAELAVESADQQQVIEVGWIVAPLIYRDGRPHLFVHYWLNGIAQGYNSNFSYVGGPKPGQPAVIDGRTHLYVIRYIQGNWWIRYDNTWIGYYLGTIWNTAPHGFTQVSTAQWFGEVEVPTSARYPCSIQMGTGLYGHSNGSAVITGMYFVVNGYAITAQAQAYQPTTRFYDVGNFTGSSLTYGGPGDTNANDCPCEFCFIQQAHSAQTIGVLPKKIYSE